MFRKRLFQREPWLIDTSLDRGNAVDWSHWDRLRLPQITNLELKENCVSYHLSVSVKRSQNGASSRPIGEAAENKMNRKRKTEKGRVTEKVRLLRLRT